MTTAEGLPPKDFFIDIGSREGIRDGDILTVYRVMPVINGLAGTPYHLMRVPLGELRVMTTGEAVSMGRLHVQRDINEMPAMVSQQFMLGDQVQLKSSLPFH